MTAPRIGTLRMALLLGLVVSLLIQMAGSAHAQDLLISNVSDDSIGRYNGTTLTTFVSSGRNGIQAVRDMQYGPDGNLYVTSQANNSIYQLDPQGNFLKVFATGGTSLNRQTFGPDGNLYVTDDGPTSQVLRFNGQTGAYMGVFASGGGLGLPRGLKFGPDGNLYVVSGQAGGYILRYNGTTGTYIDKFASGNLMNPIDLTFGPDNNLYVTDVTANKVVRYNGTTGQSMGDFVAAGSGGLLVPVDLKFQGNYLYVAGRDSHQVLRYDARTGAYVDAYVSGGATISRFACCLFPPRPLLLPSISTKMVTPT